MKYRYKIHPYDFILGENEKFYSDLEAEGWRVIKRGRFLSKFAAAQPSRVRYRLEVAAPGFMENGSTMPPEQQAVYEDCGWEYVLGRGLLHLFRAPEDSDAPEFYMDPADQIPAIEALRRQNYSGWVPAMAFFACNMFLVKYRVYGVMGIFRSWHALMAAEPWAVGIITALFLLSVYQAVEQTWYVNRVCRHLKQGIPLDHSPQGQRPARKIVYGALLAMLVLCTVMTVMQRVRMGPPSPAAYWSAYTKEGVR